MAYFQIQDKDGECKKEFIAHSIVVTPFIARGQEAQKIDILNISDTVYAWEEGDKVVQLY